MNRYFCFAMVLGSFAVTTVILPAADGPVLINPASATLVPPAPAPPQIVPTPAPAGPEFPAPSTGEGELAPLPAPTPDPTFQPATPRSVPSVQPIPIYTNVRIDDRDEIPRGAVPKIVPVKDTRPGAHPDQIVYVKIFVPPRGHYRSFKLERKSRDGSKVEYDYGDFEVEIVSRRGVVYIEYDD